MLDTSYVVEALLSGQTHHRACAEALEHVVELSDPVSYSSLLELELVEACYQVALRDQYGKQWKRARRDGRARRRLAGRKREAGSAILGLDGAVRARARALWIELRPEARNASS